MSPGTVFHVKELQEAFHMQKRKSAKGLRIGLMRAGLFLQRESQKLVPVDTGALRASASTRAEGVGFKTVVIVSYSQVYALYQHEELELQHTPGRQAKYLEQPFREKRQRMSEIIAEAVVGAKV